MGEKDGVVGRLREEKRGWKWKEEEEDFERIVAICGDDANAALAMASYSHLLIHPFGLAIAITC